MSDAEAAHVEELLDEAVAETFPCSDPIAVSCLAERIAARDERRGSPDAASPAPDGSAGAAVRSADPAESARRKAAPADDRRR